jgi:SAM-dependent methyltransferase
MQLEASDLADFYETPMGQGARRAILRRIKAMWPEVKARRVLGYGYAVPYLTPWMAEAERVTSFMSAQQGVIAWPQSRNLTVLGDENALPFPDAFFDRILVVHGLEGADSARPLLRQLWRVLAPEGRVLIVAPNRASPWAQLVHSPFALGRPYHRLELSNLLTSALLEPTAWDRALHLPPITSRRLIGTGTTWENIGRRGWPALAGVHLVEATKSLVTPLTEAARVRGKRVLSPARARSVTRQIHDSDNV